MQSKVMVSTNKGKFKVVDTAEIRVEFGDFAISLQAGILGLTAIAYKNGEEKGRDVMAYGEVHQGLSEK